MKRATQNTTIQNFFSGIRMIFLFVLLVSSSFTMVGQNKNEFAITAETFQVVASDDTVVASQSNATTNTSMNFVSWFMGTKQTPNANQSGDDAAVSQKKQMINSGIAPNRLLIKAFLKKASNYSTTIA
jgi:hypothetical protein